ncbi:MAG: thiolase C-terminal domain-containing protein [Candidatus Aenigmatarchaeota archaeon]
MDERVAVIGVGHTEFGELWDRSWVELVEEAGLKALEDARIRKKQIQKFFLGNMSLGMFGGQEHTASKVFSEIFNSGPESEILGRRIEGACSSGGLALEASYNDVLAGIQEGEDRIIMVGGFEKMTDKPTEKATKILSAASDMGKEIGFTFPSLYGMLKDRYLEETDAKEQDFDYIAVKSHKNASLNPKAQYPFEVSQEQVEDSFKVASPTKLLNSSGIADGAASVIITTESKAKELGSDYVILEGVEGANDSIALFEREEILSLVSTQKAAKRVYEATGIQPEDVDVAEVHDCFSIAEALALEDLGFSPKKEAWKWIRKSLSDCEEKEAPIPYTLPKNESLFVNTSGGLKAKGHPVGATGVAQVVEVVKQLRGEADERQVPDAEVGLTHNVGGSGGTAVVSLFKKPKIT